ncbi:MAG: hypothetical protein KGL39_06410 [Patescibacteria group bacterium]|nr:hypothetical protein [Patescibacteria group bacterium]
MTSSGTYSYSLSNADVMIEGYSRCGVRRTSLLSEHIADGRNAVNLAMVKFSNLIPNLWAEEQYTLALSSGVTTYNLPARAVMILSCFIRTGSGTSQNDRIQYPVSEYEYASYTNKNQQGFPSTYWFYRAQIPTISFYLTPDGNGPYTAYFQFARQLQDANLPSGETPDVPYRFLDALCAEVAYRLSRVYAPDKEQMRKADAQEAWAIAATNDVENVPLAVAPMLNGYYR